MTTSFRLLRHARTLGGKYTISAYANDDPSGGYKLVERVNGITQRVVWRNTYSAILKEWKQIIKDASTIDGIRYLPLTPNKETSDGTSKEAQKGHEDTD